jgi:CRP-like cAMP-binding protein
MPQDLILKNIAKHIALDKDDEAFFLTLLKSKEVSKKTLLLKEGQICKYINFVNSGALRAFHVDKEDKEATIMFALPDWWITDMYCFLHEKPAMVNIEAIEDSNILQLSKANLEKLYHQVPKFERFFRILMQNAYTREQLRIIENLTLSAEQRYEHFLDKYPLFAKAVSQKQIASYLGITPEFLSAIRKKKIKR